MIDQNFESLLKMDSYIIRIYRRDTDQPEAVLGVLETTSDGTKRSFQSRDELWQLLADAPVRDEDTNTKSTA